MVTAEFSKFAGILSAALSQHHLSGFVEVGGTKESEAEPVELGLALEAESRNLAKDESGV